MRFTTPRTPRTARATRSARSRQTWSGTVPPSSTMPELTLLEMPLAERWWSRPSLANSEARIVSSLPGVVCGLEVESATAGSARIPLIDARTRLKAPMRLNLLAMTEHENSLFCNQLSTQIPPDLLQRILKGHLRAGPHPMVSERAKRGSRQKATTRPARLTSTGSSRSQLLLKLDEPRCPWHRRGAPAAR